MSETAERRATCKTCGAWKDEDCPRRPCEYVPHAVAVSEHRRRNIKEFNLDDTDPFTKAVSCMFAFQDAYNEKCAALTRCQEKVHALEAEVIKLRTPTPEPERTR